MILPLHKAKTIFLKDAVFCPSLAIVATSKRITYSTSVSVHTLLYRRSARDRTQTQDMLDKYSNLN